MEIRKTAAPTSCGLITQRNKVHHVYTVERVARDLGVSEALIQELTLGLEPEDGVIWWTAPMMTRGSWPSPMSLHAAPLVILHPVPRGRICLSNNAAERALHGISIAADKRAAVLYSMIVSAKINDIDPQAWLAES
ncbi:hypothetical protein MES5069_450012 [Mesorhizobium escarrei]|uniref:Uncharacterized protein n=1 Tax=Mesorhizobium escarrei TaxID=666018 RepID=A0ABM9E7A0_9HYPH|nr:hypothetical protein MES5069_450012 [Mesorhizobium escarrei]